MGRGVETFLPSRYLKNFKPICMHPGAPSLVPEFSPTRYRYRDRDEISPKMEVRTLVGWQKHLQ